MAHRGGLLLVAAAVWAGGCSGDDGPGLGSCSVCSISNYDCEVTGRTPTTGTATVTTPESFGCSGTLSAAVEVVPFWIHCDANRICVEHFDECSSAVLGERTFSYSWETGAVTCTAR